jgi:hypothetical protein
VSNHRPDRTQVHQALDCCFNLEELRTLCFELGLDYDDLPAEGKEAKARELVVHHERHGTLHRLVKLIRARRPQALQPEPGDDDGRWRRAVMAWLSDPSGFSDLVLYRPLRSYQLEAAHAILDSIISGLGLTFVVTMSRQAGKNELSGQLEAYLLNLFQRRGCQIVKASPTYKPQTVNSILRLTDRLDNVWNRGRWRRREGYIVQLGKARTVFLSADPAANVVGATADALLEADEAQDIQPKKWYKDFLPMGASTNCTRVLYGTAWTNDTLLNNHIQELKRQEQQDGRRRVFSYAADIVGHEVPAYASFVEGEVARLGRNHPIIRSQYFLETIDAEGGLFSEMRRALMRGGHQRQHEPTPGKRYAILLDVAGEDEEAGDPLDRAMLEHPKRDATALTVVEIDVEFGRLPNYRVVDRRLWLGAKHSTLHNKILALATHWGAVWIVVDATGVGAGLASFLEKALGDKVLPLVFSPKIKSDLGWKFIATIETGRFSDYQDDHEPDTRQFWYEVEACQYQVHDGPGKRMSWGVWDTPGFDGMIAYGHDDLLISAALCSILDDQDWPGTGPSAVIHLPDELDEIDAATW